MRAGIGFLVWIAIALATVANMLQTAWAHALLLLAAWVLVPLVWELVRLGGENQSEKILFSAIERGQMPAALLLTIAYWPGLGRWAALGVIPWTLVTFGIGAVGLLRLTRRGRASWPERVKSIGLVYAAVGGGWTLLDRVGANPLSFSPDIVLLTAVHFHYAGLVLPVVAGLVAGELRSRAASVASSGVVFGVPLVAAGITATQLGWGRELELVAAWVLALSAIGVAALQLRLALQARWPVMVRLLWTIAAASLTWGMLLAGMYASRGYFNVWPWLDIPWMRALHGTANAFGFALAAMVGWNLAVRRRTA